MLMFYMFNINFEANFMSVATQLPLSAQDYLDGERTAEQKHQLIDGVAYAMAGASRNHNRITINTITQIEKQLMDGPYQTFSADMKVAASGDYYYPDVMVVCKEDEQDSDYVVHSPSLIVEVLSKSTRALDRSNKQVRYLQIPSLEYYVLIEQDFCEITLLSREQGFIPQSFYFGDTMSLPAINVELEISELYQQVKNEDMSKWLQNQAQHES